MKKVDHSLRPFQVEYCEYDHTIEDKIYNNKYHVSNLYKIGKVAAPHPRKGLSFINSNALSQIENLAFEVKTSIFSIIENLSSTLEGIILIANSLKP